MKIAVLTNGYGTVKRGAERFTDEFKKHMSKYHEIDVFSTKDTNTKTRDDIHIPWRNGKAYREAYLFGKVLFNSGILKDYDLILNNSGFPCSYWCSKYRKRYNIPFITRARGGGKEEYLSRLFKPDHMIFLTEQHKNRIAGKRPSSVIPNAIDLSDYENLKKTSLLKDMERPVYLSTSAFVSFKRLHLVVEAFSLLTKGTLVLTGSGPLRGSILALCEKRIPNRYSYLGTINEKLLRDIYYSSDVYVNASKKEAFGVVYLEAMASGIPVVSQNDSRRREIIGDAGILVDCTNIEDFAAGMKKASEKNFNTKEQVSLYTWDRIELLYKDIIDKFDRKI